MHIDIQICLGPNYKEWCNKYGTDFVDAVIESEAQLHIDNLKKSVFKKHKDIFPELVKG